MIDQQYLELINKDIDDTISEQEKEVLNEYLKINPSAYTMHQELSEIEKLLDKIPDKDPSDALKTRILNSIDVDRYTRKKKLGIKDYFFVSLSVPRKKLSASFALGLIAGMVLLSIIFYASFYNGFSEGNHIIGTMGLAESQVIQTVNVNSLDITGKIDIIKAADQYAIYVNLKSSGKYTLQVELDNEYLKIDNLAGTESNNHSPYTLMFSVKERPPQKLLLTILREDSKMLKREISLKNE